MQRTQNLWAIPAEQERAMIDYLADAYAGSGWGRRPPLPARLLPPADYRGTTASRPHSRALSTREESTNGDEDERATRRETGPRAGSTAMIESIWLAGAVAGALAGSVHAVDIYRRCARAPAAGGLRGRARATYYAVWTLALWVLFGAYVLIVWLLGLLLYAAAGRPPPPAADRRAGGTS